MPERAAFHSLCLDYHQYLQSGASGADLNYKRHFATGDVAALTVGGQMSWDTLVDAEPHAHYGESGESDGSLRYSTATQSFFAVTGMAGFDLGRKINFSLGFGAAYRSQTEYSINSDPLSAAITFTQRGFVPVLNFGLTIIHMQLGPLWQKSASETSVTAPALDFGFGAARLVGVDGGGNFYFRLGFGADVRPPQ